MRKIRIGLIGFGTVGSGVVKILKKKRLFLKRKSGIEIILKRVCDIDFRRRRGISLNRSIITKDYRDVIKDPDIDIVIELVGGIHPAKEIIMGALSNGKDVVTANKALLAEEGSSIFELAARAKREVYFEASVGAGIPIIKSIRESLIANKFNTIYGIVNGTSNFILSKMSSDYCTFAEALREARRRGFAEKRPRLDIEGIDSAHKLLLLVRLAFGKILKLNNIFVEGIRSIELSDVKYAAEMNLEIKLLAIAKKIKDELEVRVHPTLISKEHMLASVDGIFNAIYVDTDTAGELLFYGQGAGSVPSSSSVVSDIMDLAKRRLGAGQNQVIFLKDNSIKRLRKMDEIFSRYYIRFMAIDRPGVLSRISACLGKHNISIASVSQKERKRARVVPIVMITHEAKERSMHNALEEIYRLAVIRERPVAIRMEEL